MQEVNSMARKTKQKKRSYGTGTVIERGRGVTIGWREAILQDDGTIKRVMRWKALGPVSRTEANETLQALVDSGKTPRPGSKTFGEVAARWKTIVLPVRKYSTRKHHADILENKILPVFGHMNIDEISNQDVQQFVTELQRRNYAPHSIDHYHNVLSTILSKAVKWGYLEANPARGVELPRIVPKREQWILTVPQATQILNRLPACTRCAVALALLTGMRRGELFALRWRDFAESAGVLIIERAVYDKVFRFTKNQKELPACRFRSPRWCFCWNGVGSQKELPQTILFLLVARAVCEIKPGCCATISSPCVGHWDFRKRLG